jgi:creatinine amidohydrolase/Fe(II)-dependent formamide hydrolase-like protein
MIDDWSRLNATGVEGDATLATAEKGRVWAEATVDRLVSFLDDFRQHPIRPRRNFNFVPEDVARE